MIKYQPFLKTPNISYLGMIETDKGFVFCDTAHNYNYYTDKNLNIIL